ncbi:MAG: Mur ligase domain-containing protein, partial [Hyphomicrobiales bacterium]|nr:Mur ligase domain-containing protein [Hyphomicrobiales bacterium]
MTAASPALWAPEALVAATGGLLTNPPAAPIRSVSIDTRTLEPGALFFAIRGETHDGHDFVPMALEKGAAAAVVARAHAGRYGAAAP